MTKTAQSGARQGRQTRDASAGEAMRSENPSAQTSLAHLQSAHGNQEMQRLLAGGVLQAKLAISQPGDVYEQEADRVADTVMRMPDPTASPERVGSIGSAVTLQRACACGTSGSRNGECEGCRSAPPGLQKSSAGPSPGKSAPPIVHDVLRSPGRPLDTTTRSFMEPRFGRDFSKVRVHTDAAAAASAEAIGALAYTVGAHIVFGRDQHLPQGRDGKKLIAHELTHVMQQNRAIRPESANRQEQGAEAPDRSKGRESAPLPFVAAPFSLQRFAGCTADQDHFIERHRKHAIEKAIQAITAIADIQNDTGRPAQRAAFHRHFGTLSDADTVMVRGTFNQILSRLTSPGTFRCDTAVSYPHCGPPDNWCAGTLCPDMGAVSHLCVPRWIHGLCLEPSRAQSLIHESARAAGCCSPDIQVGHSGYPPPAPAVLTNVFSYTGFSHEL